MLSTLDSRLSTQRFLSAEPVVRLVNSFARPFDNAVATARTCYSGKGVVTVEQVGADAEPDAAKKAEKLARRDELAESLYQAGHHTVFQHAHFQFALSNISRQFAWTFLHSHPFYNSEQVSQRYVEVKPDMYVVPALEGEAREIYTRTLQRQYEAYHRLTELLGPIVCREYYARFRARANQREKWDKEAKKKALEIARYVLPIATFTYMYHTVSGVTLLRYWRLCETFDAPSEQRLVVGKMVEELLRVAPEYETILHEPIPLEETPEFAYYHPERAVTPQLDLGIARAGGATPAAGTSEFRREFDAGLEGRVSKLIDWKQRNELVFADSVREVLGVTRSQLGDDEAIELALNPSRNPLLGDELNLTTLSKLSRAMVHPNYTFRKKLSHTADSQDQRHRMTPASRPCLNAYLTTEPDYILPDIVRMDSVVEKAYAEAMEASWQAINDLRWRGVPDEFAAYLLPNAVAIRFTESADLMSLHHKHAMRLCYNAQEEIWRASKDEAEQVREVNPRIGKWLLPPCGHRAVAGSTPICPEGVRFCGITVWKLDLSQYERVI